MLPESVSIELPVSSMPPASRITPVKVPLALVNVRVVFALLANLIKAEVTEPLRVLILTVDKVLFEISKVPSTIKLLDVAMLPLSISFKVAPPYTVVVPV